MKLKKNKNNFRSYLQKLISKIVFKMYFPKSEINVSDTDFIERYLKKNGYTKYGDLHSKGFILIELHKKDRKVTSVEVWHDKVSTTKQVINNNFSTGLIIAERYFSRI